MPKVLRIINRLNLGGPTFNVAYLSKYMSGDFETLLVAGMKDESEASSSFIVEDLGIQPRFIKNMYREINPVKDYPAFMELVQIIREFKPDIVHTHAAKAGAIGRMAAIYCKVPIVIHTFHGHVFHSYFSTIKTRIFIGIERWLAARSTKIVAISNLQKKELCQDFKIAKCDKFSIVPLGFDLDRFQINNDKKRIDFRNNYNLKEEDVALGIIGRLVPIKNHELFLNAFKKVKESAEYPVKAFIIGDGELRQELEAKCKQLNLSVSLNDAQHADVVFTSWISNIDEALPGLDTVVLCSLNEGTPVSLIEAQAANVAIVSTRVGGIEDVVAENETALLSDSGDVDGLYENLQLLVNNPLKRKEMGKKGYELVKNKFSYTTLCSNMEQLYRSLLANNKD